MPKNGDLKVWWIPQVPMKKFEYPVKSIDHAISILDVLAKYDIFQYKNNVKPDFCNVGGLLIYNEEDIENGIPETGWTEWCDDEGQTIDELMRNDYFILHFEQENTNLENLANYRGEYIKYLLGLYSKEEFKEVARQYADDTIEQSLLKEKKND